MARRRHPLPQTRLRGWSRSGLRARSSPNTHYPAVRLFTLICVLAFRGGEVTGVRPLFGALLLRATNAGPLARWPKG